jgi:hypothetical protein
VAMCCASQEARKVVVGRSDTSSDWIRSDQCLARDEFWFALPLNQSPLIPAKRNEHEPNRCRPRAGA